MSTAPAVTPTQDELLKEAVAYVNQAGPVLEKAAAAQASLNHTAGVLPAKMLAYGLISRLDAEKLAADIAGPNGVAKLAEASEYLLTHVVKLSTGLGNVSTKEAALGTPAPAPRTSAQVWEAGFSSRTRRV